MKNIFICKPATLEELKDELQRTANHETGYEPEAYRIAATRRISPAEWDDLTSCFLDDREWLSNFSKKLQSSENTDWSKRNCIKVTCKGQPFSLLIDTQGYDYARYVAILED